MEWDWRKNDGMKTCHICGRENAHTRNSMSVGMCPVHLKMWEEDIDYGLYRRNRLRDIMVERGEVSQFNNSPNGK